MTPLDDHIHDDGLALGARVARRDTTAVDLLEAALSLTARLYPALDAFDTVAADRAFERARRSADPTGRPAISVPGGMSGGGLPVGVQQIGRFGEDATVPALAAQIEAAKPWAASRPRIV
jgi:Asp-tRNA(Asn)/Glu-tRNA(Gln) amidotransferase A subunit family amidase